MGLDVAPSMEEIGADTSTLTNTSMQVNVLSDREIKAESDAADINLRQSVKNDSLIPAVGARPGMTVDLTQPSRFNYVLDEVSKLSMRCFYLNFRAPYLKPFITSSDLLLSSNLHKYHWHQMRC